MDSHCPGFLLYQRGFRAAGTACVCALDERVEKGTLALQTEGQKPNRTWVSVGATEAGFLDNRREVQKHGTAESGHHARGAFVHATSMRERLISEATTTFICV